MAGERKKWESGEKDRKREKDVTTMREIERFSEKGFMRKREDRKSEQDVRKRGGEGIVS